MSATRTAACAALALAASLALAGCKTDHQPDSGVPSGWTKTSCFPGEGDGPCYGPPEGDSYTFTADNGRVERCTITNGRNVCEYLNEESKR